MIASPELPFNQRSLLLENGIGFHFMAQTQIIRRKFKMDTLFTSHLSNMGSRLEQFTLDQNEQREDDHLDQMWRLYNANPCKSL
jgi:hypothetical protein